MSDGTGEKGMRGKCGGTYFGKEGAMMWNAGSPGGGFIRQTGKDLHYFEKGTRPYVLIIISFPHLILHTPSTEEENS